MEFSLEERSELRLAIIARASEPDASYDTRRILTSAYARLAAADGFKTGLPRLEAEPARPKPASIADILERLGAPIEAELDATAAAVLALEDRIARSPVLRNFGGRA